MNENNNMRDRVFVLFVFLLSFLIRIFVAPYSTGVDVPQFWAFAKVFDQFGFQFYRYADATLDIFPVAGWSYNYTPLWVLVLYLVFQLVPTSIANTQFVDTSWRWVAKFPLIISDLLIGILIYKMVSGTWRRKLKFTCLWLFSPLVWYESSIFGQFDSLMMLFLIAGLYFLNKNRNYLALTFFALSILTKQHSAIAIIFIYLAQLKNLSLKEIFSRGFLLIFIFSVFSLPFVLGSDLKTYIHYLFVPMGWLRYQEPLVYAASGMGSMLTYVHHVWGYETLSYMQYAKGVLGFCLIIVAVLIVRRGVTPEKAALLGFALLFGLSPNVNYQYLVAVIPLGVLLLSQELLKTKFWHLLALTLYPSLWIWMFPITFWFEAYNPKNNGAIEILKYFGFGRFYLADGYYVLFFSVNMLLLLSFVAFNLPRRRET